MEKDDGDLPPLPPIPHERLSRDGPAGGLLRNTKVEVRGLRTLRRNEYHDIALTIAEADFQPDSASSMFDVLRATADEVLKAAGWESCSETLASVDQPNEPSSLPGVSAGTLALATQSAAVIEKHGELSPEAAAVRFALLTHRVFQELGLNGEDDKTALLLEWANAWYWHRFEISEAHALAFSGLKALAGRNASGPARSKRKARAEEIVRANFGELDISFQTDLDAAAMQLIASVNSRLTEAKLKTYEVGTLRKMLSKLGLVKAAKAQKKHAPPSGNL